jgi:hypothetical protein
MSSNKIKKFSGFTTIANNNKFATAIGNLNIPPSAIQLFFKTTKVPTSTGSKQKTIQINKKGETLEDAISYIKNNSTSIKKWYDDLSSEIQIQLEATGSSSSASSSEKSSSDTTSQEVMDKDVNIPILPSIPVPVNPNPLPEPVQLTANEVIFDASLQADAGAADVPAPLPPDTLNFQPNNDIMINNNNTNNNIPRKPDFDDPFGSIPEYNPQIGSLDSGGNVIRTNEKKITDNVEIIKDIQLLTPEGMEYTKLKLQNLEKLYEELAQQIKGTELPYPIRNAIVSDNNRRYDSRIIYDTEMRNNWFKYSRQNPVPNYNLNNYY